MDLDLYSGGGRTMLGGHYTEGPERDKFTSREHTKEAVHSLIAALIR